MRHWHEPAVDRNGRHAQRCKPSRSLVGEADGTPLIGIRASDRGTSTIAVDPTHPSFKLPGPTIDRAELASHRVRERRVLPRPPVSPNGPQTVDTDGLTADTGVSVSGIAAGGRSTLTEEPVGGSGPGARLVVDLGSGPIGSRECDERGCSTT